MSKPRGLGRGLSALIGDGADATPDQQQNAAPKSKADTATADTSPPKGPYMRLGVDQLRPGTFQPRQNFDEDDLESLSKSLKEKGILQPLLVRSVADGGYEIVAGERRWRAAQRAGLHEVPVVVESLTDREALEIGIIENVQRADLNAIEEAEAFQRLMDEFKYTQDALAKVIGKSRSHIANTLRLISLPKEVRALVISGALSPGHARTLIGHENAVSLANKIVRDGLSVRDVEKLLSHKKKNPQQRLKSDPSKHEKDADTLALEKTLSDGLGLAVSIEDTGRGGKLSVDYKTLEQLDDVIRRLLTG